MKPDITFVKVDDYGCIHFDSQEDFDELVEKIYEKGYKLGFKEGKAEGLATPSTITTTTTTWPSEGFTINPNPYDPMKWSTPCQNDTKFFE